MEKHLYQANVNTGSHQTSTVKLEKHLKENIIEQGRAVHGSRYPFHVLVGTTDHLHTAYLVRLKDFSKWEILTSGRGAGSVVEAYEALLDVSRREFAGMVAGKLGR